MRIITDSGSLFTPQQGEEMGIDVLPLNVIINKKSYREFVDIQSEEFLSLINEGHIPTSSQPAIGETMEALEKYPNEDILVLNMADGLSGAYQSTLSVKGTMENNEHIHVINTMTLCGPEKGLVEKAISLKEKGMEIHEVIKEIHKSIATEKSFLIPQDFGYLKRGGRLTPIAATIGGLLKIIPVMTTTKDGKRLEKFTMKKTFKSAIKEIIKAFKDLGVDENYKIYVSHGGVLEQAQQTMKQIQEAFENVKIELHDLSPAFITQGGPGCIAIQWVLN